MINVAYGESSLPFQAVHMRIRQQFCCIEIKYSLFWQFISNRSVSYSAWLHWFCGSIFVVEGCHHRYFRMCRNIPNLHLW